MTTISSIFAGITQVNKTFNTSGDVITIYGKTIDFVIANAAILNITNGGNTSGTSIQEKAVENVYNNGSATSTIVNNNGAQNVYNNGSTTSTIVNNNGKQNIRNHASAYNTILNNGGIQNIYDGGYAYFTTVNSGGYITTTQNGISFQPYIQSGGYEDVGFNKVTNQSIAGSSISAQIYGGSQYVYSGSIASTATVFNGGTSYILAGGSAINTIVNSGGLQKVNGVVSNTTLNNTAVLDVTYGGTTFGTKIQEKSAENVFDNGSATGTVINDNGAQNVYNNGSTTSTIVNNSASQNVYNNASAYVTLLNSGGVQNIYDSGHAYYTTVKLGGYITTTKNGVSFQPDIQSGGYEDVGFNRVTNQSGVGSSISAQLHGGSQYVYSGSIASTATVFNGGVSYILAGGSAGGTVVYSGGLQNISGTINNAASASGTVIFTGGQQTIYDWGRAENLTLSGGIVNVSAGGGIIGNINFSAGGTVNVYSGASVSTQVTNGGKEYIYNGGGAVDTVVNGGYQYVMNGGKITNTSVISQGSIYVSSGATASGVSVANGGNLSVFTGGVVNSATINAEGIVVVNGGSIANNTVTNGGILNINSGSLGLTTISSGGSLIMATDSTTLTGQVRVMAGGFINRRMALQDIVINNLTRDNLTALLNDPTLFVSTDPTVITTDKNQSSPTITTNTDTGKTDLNSLLNNPDYFTPVSVTPQASMLKTRDFIAPMTFAMTADALPATDPDGNAITWDPDDQNPSDAASVALSLKGYTVNSDGSTYSSFIPPGGTEADRIYKVGMPFQGASEYLPGTMGFGSVLVYGDSADQQTQPGYDYPDKTYITGGVKLAINTATTVSDLTVYDTSTVNATNGTIVNLRVGDGAVANIADPAKITGTFTLESGGKANITTSTGGIISLAGTENQGLVISGKAVAGGTTVASTINDFDGNDRITLADIQRSDVASVKFDDKDHITITLKDGSFIDLNIIDIETTGYSLGENPDGSLVFEVCFLTGTSIATLNGVMTVENINIGDVVETFDWQSNQKIGSAVTWVGKKYTTVKKYLSDDLAGYPVRVLKNAIAENVPNEDLLITPEHCLFFDGNFIPARMLVNGRSIYYDLTITSYDYYHIETEKHSVIWANGTLTESYLDTGNRNSFANGQRVVSLFSDAKKWDIDAAAPLNVQRDVVEPIYNQINNRAVQSNILSQTESLSLTNDPNLCLITKLGTIIQPHSINNGKYIFAIPECVNDVQIHSRTARPCETIGSFIDDRRDLGILVGSVFIVNNDGVHEVTDYLSDTDLAGWDVVEQSPCRWTNGNASLNIHASYLGKRILIINILAGGPYIEEKFTEEQNRIAS